MKKNLFLITLILCLALTACGNKNTQEVQDIQNTASVDTTSIEKETEEVKITEEENIGDAKMKADELSMADMREFEVGIDFPSSEIDVGTSSIVEGFKVLFPSEAYITKTTVASAEVELESIHFILSITTRNQEAPTSARENRGETLETIENYVVLKRVITDSDNSYGVDQSYYIYDTESGKSANILIVINKRSDYQEYGDKLVKEYMPKFEEVLYSNLQ